MNLFTWEINKLVKKLEYHFLHQLFVVGHSIFLLLSINTCFYLCISWLLQPWSPLQWGRAQEQWISCLGYSQGWQGQAVLALVVLADWGSASCSLRSGWRLSWVSPVTWGASSAVPCLLGSQGLKQWNITGTAHSQTKSSDRSCLTRMFPSQSFSTWKIAAFLVTLSFSSVNYEL